MAFTGFKDKTGKNTPLPGQFFSELLPQIDHLGELKLSLYFIWRVHRMEGTFRYLNEQDIAEDSQFMQGMGANKRERQVALKDALERAVLRGTLLRAVLTPAQAGLGSQTLYFLNTPKGRAAIKGLEQGKWRPEELHTVPVELALERPNIFQLYEAHIGPLTPMISETLRDAEENYPSDWIEDAVQIAVENNIRRWRYVEAILKSWHEKGRDEQTDRRSSQKDHRKYIQGEFSDFIEH